MLFVKMNYTDNVDIACRNQDVLHGLGAIKLNIRPGQLGTQIVVNPTYPSGPVDMAPVLRALEPDLDQTERTA